MKFEENKVQIGDVLYYVSKTYNTVFEYTVKDIFVEEYVSGYKTIFFCTGYDGTLYSRKEFFLSDMMDMFDTKEEAEKELEKIKKNSNNPVKTRQSEILKQFPNVRMKDGFISLCPDEFINGYAYRECKSMSVAECDECRKKFWLEEIEDE